MTPIQESIAELRSTLAKVAEVKKQIAARERDQTETAARIKAAKESGAVDDAEAVRKLADDLARAEMLPAKLKQLREQLSPLIENLETCLSGVEAHFGGLYRTTVAEAEANLNGLLSPLLVSTADADKYARELALKTKAVEAAESKKRCFTQPNFAFVKRTEAGIVCGAEATLSTLVRLEQKMQ